METRARYVLIGLFTLVVIAAGFGFVYWLENSGGLGEQKAYEVRFQGSVSGLLLGSDVSFNGIRVGEVTKLSLNPSDPRQVVVQIAVPVTTPVRSDTKVGLSFKGLTGVPVIVLEGGTPEAPPPTAGDGGIPVLTADPGANADWTAAARDAFAEVQSVLADNSDALKDAIANIDTFSQALGRNAGSVDGIVAGIEKLTGGGSNKNKIIYDLDAPTTFPSIAKVPDGQLIVATPTAALSLDTQQFLTTADGGLKVAFDGSLWADSVTRLVQARVIQGFANAGYSRVGSDVQNLNADHTLTIDVRAFHMTSDGGPMAKVDFGAKITTTAGDVVAAKEFSAEAPAKAMDAESAAAAIDTAFGQASSAMIAWAMGAIAGS